MEATELQQFEATPLSATAGLIPGRYGRSYSVAIEAGKTPADLLRDTVLVRAVMIWCLNTPKGKMVLMPARTLVSIDMSKARQQRLPATFPRSKTRYAEKLLAGCPKTNPTFIEPMRCRPAASAPQGGQWLFELKLDGYRALAIKAGTQVKLISRNGKSLAQKFPELSASISQLPREYLTLDGEIVMLDDKGLPSFQALQNIDTFSGDRRRLFYFAFDVLNYSGHDTTRLKIEDRKLLLAALAPFEVPHLRFARAVDGDSSEILLQVQNLGMEGIIAKRKGSGYEPGQRSGAWIKYKLIKAQEFVVGGYTAPQGTGKYFGALLVGYYKDGELRYVSRVGSGFTARVQRQLFERMQSLGQRACPFVNLPQERKGKWGEGLTAADMKKCVWVRPDLVCQVHYTEWTEADHLRHPIYKGLVEDRTPIEVTKEVATI